MTTATKCPIRQSEIDNMKRAFASQATWQLEVQLYDIESNAWVYGINSSWNEEQQAYIADMIREELSRRN